MTKDFVLSVLKNSNDYVSGEKISETLGVSRAAVNVAIKALRGEGYDILSSTNKGYFLSSSPDLLNAGELLTCLPAERLARVLCINQVDSTNNKLRELAQKGAPAGQIVFAEQQTGGRGRMGRSFFSPKGKNIYLSFLMRPQGAPSQMSAVTAWTAVATCRAIETVCGIRPGIKWINDLVLGGRKICGILTEMSIESESGHIQYVIVGVGVNVNMNREDFPSEICEVATSLRAETGQCYARAQLAAALIEQFDRLMRDWPQERDAYFKEYVDASIAVGKEVQLLRGDTVRTAFVEGIGKDFGLNVRYEDGTKETIISGDVSVRGLYGNPFCENTRP